jgi:hypothetical protein
MSVKLPASVYSPDQVSIVIWELGGVVAKLRDARTKKSVTGNTSLPAIHFSKDLAQVLRNENIDLNDTQSLESLHEELKDIRSNAPIAHLLLTASPTHTLRAQLVTWCRENLHPDLLITFAARGDLGGGFILRVGSKQYDFTYRARLLDQKHRLVEIFDDLR